MSPNSPTSGGRVPLSSVRFWNPIRTSAAKGMSAREIHLACLRLHNYFLVHTISDEIDCLHVPIFVTINSIPIANVSVGKPAKFQCTFTRKEICVRYNMNFNIQGMFLMRAYRRILG